MTFLDLYLLFAIAAAACGTVIGLADEMARRQTKWLIVAPFIMAWSPFFGTFLLVEKMTGLPFEQAITASLSFGQLTVVVPIVLIPIIGVFWLAKMAIDALVQTSLPRKC